jgi:predicted AAA+ superfamily ATPase
MLEKIIVDNVEFVKAKFNEIKPRLIDVPDSCVLVGIRRAGKTYLLYQKARQFDDKFLYINFEDERLV